MQLEKVWMRVEGIEIFKLDEADDPDIEALIDGRTGFIMLLDDKCFRVKGITQTLCTKSKLCTSTQNAFGKTSYSGHMSLV